MIHIFINVILLISSQVIFWKGYIEDNVITALLGGIGIIGSIFYCLHYVCQVI